MSGHPKCIVCRCGDITLEEIREAVATGVMDMESLQKYFGLGSGNCLDNTCLADTEAILPQLLATRIPQPGKKQR